ncbi:MAG: zinc ABC transporter substrate-binding protein [Phycisphaeraceae bacterium]|nr:MAG: zinc ABC transporter substrate-binding protein [Phycisphaeraceae bacterium]
MKTDGGTTRLGSASPQAAALCLALLSLLASLTLSGCDRADRASRAEGPLRIGVTIPPLKEFARALAPDDTEVSVLLPPGASPHGHEPTPGSIARLVRSDVVVMVGLGLETRAHAALNKHPRPWRRLVTFAEVLDHDDLVGYQEAIKESESAHDCGHDHSSHKHSDGHDHCEHDHGPVDQHLWLDPILVERLIPALRREIEAALVELNRFDDDARARLDEAEHNLIDQVRSIHREYEIGLADLKHRTIVTHHDAYSRIAARYGLRVAAVIRPIDSVETTPGAVRNAVDSIRAYEVPAIFIEPQFSAGAAGRIAEHTGVRVLTLDPLGDGDWQAMMRRNLESLRDGLGAEASGSSVAASRHPED